MDAASLTLSEALLLFYLQDNGPVNQSQLSLMVGVGRAQVGAMVTKLCDDDLLERTKDDSDGRAWLVDLTRDGHRRAALLRRIDFEVADYVGRGMETADRRALIGLLDRVQKNLEVFDDVSLRPGKSQAEEERAG